MSESYVLELPRKQLFYRILTYIMSVYSLLDPTWWCYEPMNKFIAINAQLVRTFGPICLISQILYLIINFRKLSIPTILKIFTLLPVTCLVDTCIHCAHTSAYKKIMKAFMTKIHLYNYKHESQFVEKLFITTENYTRRVTYYLTICLMSVCLLWNILPIVNNNKNRDAIRNKTMMLETGIYLWMPFDYEYNYKNWVIIHIVNCYIAVSACTVLIIFNVAFNMILFHLIGHIKILKRKLETEFSIQLTQKQVKQRFSRLIEHHTFIIRTFDDIQDAFGLNVTTNYGQNLLGDSLILYQIMFGGEGHWMSYAMMLLAYLGSLVLMSFVLEEIRIQTDVLANTAYGIKWESMSVPNQKTLLLCLARLQPPMEFISMGGLRAGVQPMISIMKSTFSYYVMLKSTVNT